MIEGRVCSVRTRLKDILRQYELRERHFECVIRSKELEVLLSRARAAEQKQLAEGEKARAEKVEEEVRPPRPRLSFLIKEKNKFTAWFHFFPAEPATPKGVGRCAEGSDDVGRAVNIVLQRGTRFPTPHPLSPAFCQKRKNLFVFVYAHSVVLSDRDRTFAAQCRAHAALIHLASRRVGEEGEQGREDGGRRGGEWGKLVVVLDAETTSPIPMYPTAHTPFFLSPPRGTINFGAENTVHHLKIASVTSHAVSRYNFPSPSHARL